MDFKVFKYLLKQNSFCISRSLSKTWIYKKLNDVVYLSFFLSKLKCYFGSQSGNMADSIFL